MLKLIEILASGSVLSVIVALWTGRVLQQAPQRHPLCPQQRSGRLKDYAGSTAATWSRPAVRARAEMSKRGLLHPHVRGTTNPPMPDAAMTQTGSATQ